MKGRLTKLAVVLLLGAIVNVAVSYGCVLLSPGWQNVSSNSHSKFPAWPRDVPASWPAPLDLRVWSITGHTVVIASGGDRILARSFEESAIFSHRQKLIQFGWPLRSIESERRMILWDRPEYFADAGTVADFLGSSDYGYRRVPIRPIWPGFAINTVFYAAILWLPFAPFQLRRYKRVKRGHCIKCGYDLRGAKHEVCPECGCEVCTGAKV